MPEPEKKDPNLKLQLSYKDLVLGLVITVLVGIIAYQKVEISQFKREEKLASGLEKIEASKELKKQLAKKETHIESLGEVLKDERKRCEMEVKGLKKLVQLYKGDFGKVMDGSGKEKKGEKTGSPERGDKEYASRGTATSNEMDESGGKKGEEEKGQKVARPVTAQDIVNMKWRELHERAHKRIKNGSCPICYEESKNRFYSKHEDEEGHKHDSVKAQESGTSSVSVSKIETGSVVTAPVQVSPVKKLVPVGKSSSSSSSANPRSSNSSRKGYSISTEKIEKMLDSMRGGLMIPPRRKKMELE